MTVDLRLGRWQDVLADVGMVDSVIADPPYGERTHAKQRHGRKEAKYTSGDSPILASRGLGYEHLTPPDVMELVRGWAPRTRKWMCMFTSHDLVPTYEFAFKELNWYSFAPIACVQHAMNVRLAGDGPSNWTTWLMVARPKRKTTCGSLPGAYWGQSFDTGENGLDRSKRIVPGGKPLWLMQSIVRDYSRPGDLVCDPCAGGGTTLLAAVLSSRRAIGAEMNPDTHAKATARIQASLDTKHRQPGLFEVTHG